MQAENNKRNKRRTLFTVGIYISIFLLLVWIISFREINRWLESVLILLRPVLIGLALAYLLNPLFRFFERKVFFRLRPQGLRRTLSLILTYLTLILAIVLIFLLIVPQLIDTIISFINNYNSYISSAINQINKLFASINSFFDRFTGNDSILEYLDEESIRQKSAELFKNLDKTTSDLMAYLTQLNIEPLRNILSNTISIVTDTIFGIFISLYLLSTKEKRTVQVMKLRRALFSDATNERLTKFFQITDRSFGGFLEGKLLESLIVGILTYIVISIFNIPYALLIATFIGIMNIIPVIGLFIGAVPTSLILLLSAPGKVIPFLIIILVIQQINNNIISPKILGNNTGISSLCVMIAITTMGAIWGIFGMFIAVPLFAAILGLTDELVTTRLQKKGLPSGLANYYANDAIVDPTKNAHSTTDKSVQKFEKYALSIRRKKEIGEKLTRLEKFAFAIYRLAHKYHIFSELTDETHALFSAEQAAKAAAAEADALLHAKRSTPQEPADLSDPVL